MGGPSRPGFPARGTDACVQAHSAGSAAPCRYLLQLFRQRANFATTFVASRRHFVPRCGTGHGLRGLPPAGGVRVLPPLSATLQDAAGHGTRMAVDLRPQERAEFEAELARLKEEHRDLD